MTFGRRLPLRTVYCTAVPILLSCQWNTVLAFGNHAVFTGKARVDGRCVCRRTRARNRSLSRFPPVLLAAEHTAGRGSGKTWSDYDEVIMQRPIDRVVLDKGRGLRVHCLSDLHTDYKSNLAWIKTWPSWKGSGSGELGEGHEDVLVVAGDVSSSLERSAETLTDLTERYDQVFFVVGNHDLWTRRQRKPPERGDILDQQEDLDHAGSVGKLEQIHRVCETIGVRTRPAVFVLGESEGREGEWVGGERGAKRRQREEVVVFPLLSWYHASWDDEPDLPPDDQFRNGDFFRRWGDFIYCRWPVSLCSREDFVTVSRDTPPVLANFFARQNDACIEAFRARADGETPGAGGGPDAGSRTSSSTVISFSHFVPRQELCPEKRFLSEPNLTKAIGSAPLERQIRELGSDLHVFGHTHIPIDMGCDGVRYLQWPLGSVSEQSRQCRKMREQGPLVVYSHDGQKGGLSPEVPTFWGDHYRAHPRDVRETYVPEWALKRITGRRRGDGPPSPGPRASDQ